ncbi:hypothetical protein [uncultured Mediterranea sp.]|uniref:hypothetical protein n=1 Tax=uncultured Mediterranea sp. TaxID=1926662 RepID=UPI002803ECC2|nr:hypothetical protein [uncultured Mediterranea sp.]
MNKKLLWTLVLPAALASCNQDDLLSEGISNTPEGKAISGVTFTIAKNGSEAGTRAAWVDNKLSFEKGDLISLFWLGNDGYTQNNTTGKFEGTAVSLSGAVIGSSNAIFRTEDGSNFSAEAVVYEGYNLLVYPGNTSHVDPKPVVVGLPQEQKADEDFTKNVVYIGDSILHIHQPAYNATAKKYYNLYEAVATSDDPNTSGYAHGIKTGVKLLSSLLNMDFRIINTNAKDVKIEKVVLTTKGGASTIYSVEGNLVPGNTTGVISENANLSGKTQYRNPWYTGTKNVASVTLNCENIETDMAGTKVTMLLLPATTTSLENNDQPVLQVYTNYGMVQIGGDNDAASTQSNCIYKENGVDYAAASDDEALQAIVENTANYMVTTEVPSTNNTKATYTFNSGVSMTRVINVDMQKANIQDQVVSNTEELNAILNAAVQSSKTYPDAQGRKLNVVLKADKDGNFELTNYDGLNAFVQKFGANALTLGLDGNTSKNVINVIVNATEATELQSIEGLPADVTLTIPATSKISKVKTLANGYTIVNPIINQSVITVPANASITLKDNAKGTVHYTDKATIDVDNLDADTYGVIDYTANSQQSLNDALTAGVNYVTLKDITSGFFGGSVDASSAKATQQEASVTVTFDNCGNLNQNITEVKADVIILKNGTSYPDLKNATVDKIIVESETAVLGMSGNTAKDMSATKIVVKAGTTTIDNLKLGTLEVAAGATANVGTKAVAPAKFYVYGTASFAGDNQQQNGKVYTLTNGKISGIAAIIGNCLVTGSLELKSDLAYTKVAVSETTAITVAEGVTGLGYTDEIFVTKDAQAKGTANLKFNEVSYDAKKISWNGNTSDIKW